MVCRSPWSWRRGRFPTWHQQRSWRASIGVSSCSRAGAGRVPGAALGQRLAALTSAGVPASFQSLNYVALTLAATADRPGTLRALHAVENELRRSGVDDGLPDLLIVPAMLAYVLDERERARRWITAIRLAAKPTQSLPITAIYRQLRTRLGLSTDRDGMEETAAVYLEARAWLAQVAAQD